MSNYLLDSNIFIQAHRVYYPFDVVPGFWSKLAELSKRGLICSIDKVKKEICSREPDMLATWCEEELDASFFFDSSVSINIYTDIISWAFSEVRFNQNAKEDFLATDLADPWLVAYAKQFDLAIVTHEVSLPFGKKKIKIPDVCNQFGVRFISLMEMFRELKEFF